MRELRFIIAGGRDFDNYNLLESFCYKVFEQLNIQDDDKIIIIEGEAKGADTLARKFAEENNFECLKFPANWDLYGKRAGYIRNTQMANEGKADYLIAFHDGQSSGTRNMIEIMRKKDLEFNKNRKKGEFHKSSIFICRYNNGRGYFK